MRGRPTATVCVLTAILAVAVPQASSQEVANEAGPLEKRANPVTPENPIPRRLYGVKPRYPTEAVPLGTRAVVSLRLTLNESGRPAEVRATCCGLLSTGATKQLPGNVFLQAAADAVRQWVYEPPINPPISFDVTIAFGPDFDSELLTHGGVVFRPTFPPPPPPSPPTPEALAGAVWVDGAVRVGGGIRAPAKVKHVAPEYPPDAQNARVQGVVIAEIRIEQDGRVSSARVVRSIPLLDEAAVDAVMQWEFSPTMLNDKPVPVLMTVTVQFTLS